MTPSQRAVEAAASDLGVCLGNSGIFLARNTLEKMATSILTAALAVDGLCLVAKTDLLIVLGAAEMHWDEGPVGEGWQSRKLIDACDKVAQSIPAASDGEERSGPPRQEKI